MDSFATAAAAAASGLNLAAAAEAAELRRGVDREPPEAAAEAAGVAVAVAVAAAVAGRVTARRGGFGEACSSLPLPRFHTDGMRRGPT